MGSSAVDGWKVRTQIETSMAIKCPSIDVQLATFKKYQQAFSDASLLQQVTQNEEITKQASSLFKGIWSLEEYGKEGADVNHVFADAMAHPDKYVLKPQKEGGGNNYFGEELCRNLKNFDTYPQLRSYLLMEKINPPLHQGYFVRNSQLSICQCQAELGIYSVIFTKNTAAGTNELLENKTIGTILRSKSSASNEGGVVCGYGVVDAPLILPSAAIAEKSKDMEKGKIVAAVNI